ncbi:unnamed protein product [Pedinophyceae sp. YPF-701]|nr:unnamed protein product [Pedinophyceae sp. YPF-701]
MASPDSSSTSVLGHEIISAAEAGDTAAVLAAIDAGLDVNARSAFQTTLLHTAARYGHADLLSALLRRGADITALDYGGMRRSALHWACHGAHVRCVEILVDAGADTECQGRAWSRLVQGSACGALVDRTEPCPEAPESLCRGDAVLLALRRPPWSIELHSMWPGGFRAAVSELLKCNHRLWAQRGKAEAGDEGGCLPGLPMDLIWMIVRRMAYDVSAWVQEADRFAEAKGIRQRIARGVPEGRLDLPRWDTSYLRDDS